MFNLFPRRRRPASAPRQILSTVIAAFIILQPVLFAATPAAAQIRRVPASGPADVGGPNAGVTVTTLGTPYTQNFDTLPASGSATWTNDSTIPGWFHARTGTGTTIVANNGSSNAGNLYSYGTGTATDRALGSLGSGNAAIGNLFWGVRLQNNSGSTITSLDVSYTGEQWRNSAAAAQTVAFSYLVGSPTVTGTLAEFQSAGVAVPQLDFTSPVTGGAAAALDGNLAANRVTLTHTISGLNIPNGTEVMLRWSDPDHTGADHGLSIDGFSVTPQGSGGVTLSINDVTQAEGNGPGTTAFTFTVSLSSTTHGGVTFDIGTADGTAQDGSAMGEDTDYTADSLGGQTIPNGSDSYQFTVDVNGDTTNEPNETFAVNVVNIVGATGIDGQGLGTITNDDIALTPIHDIQGNGTSSPLVSQVVSTSGIVTLLKTGSNGGAGAANGFFLQDPIADADPNTSEGIFVFTSSVPSVAVGDSVSVTGTVVEFNGLTEIGSVTNTSILSTGNSLPTAVTLDATILDPTAAPTQPQLEKYEGMRMTAATLVSAAPNDNFFDVYAVLLNVPRPMREPGIPSGDPIPPDPTSGTPDPNIAIWDKNPERIKLDTNGRAGAANTPYTSNVTFTSVSGPLDYGFGEYRLVTDTTPTASANMTAVSVPTPSATEFTVAGYNIENFNNNATQREKASLTIRNVLRYPDIIGAVEIFDLADLQALRDEVNNDAVAAGDPNPAYEAYLIEQDGVSEDSDQDVGYLVKTSRVSVTSVTQEREEETFVEPGTGTVAILHDRPPLVLDAVVDPSGANPRRVLVVVNHLRSFIDAELVAGDGPRVREKRKKQAESLGGLLQELQTNNAGVPVISVGDYNAFQFSSGYDDSLSVIKGTPTPDDQIVVDQSPDVVNPDFVNLIEGMPAAERYSFVFEGTPQALDHHVVNGAALARNTRIAIARVNADFPEAPAATYASNVSIPERNSDHDPVVSYYTLGVPQPAGSVIISEYRLRGPSGAVVSPEVSRGWGARGAASKASLNDPQPTATPSSLPEDNDEFIEFYNNTDSPITVATVDGSAGWALIASDGTTRFTIPHGTVIPARGHYLAANSLGYSLSNYPGGDDGLGETFAQPDLQYSLDIPDQSGIALFNTANAANFNEGHRLDAVGYDSSPALYREGMGFSTDTPGADVGGDAEWSFVRDLVSGTSKDTGDNNADFIPVETGGQLLTIGARLGAPGPENSFAPIRRLNILVNRLDTAVGQNSPPNRVRNLTPVTNGANGTLSIRRTIVNATGAPVTRLRFRIIQITTFTSPIPTGQADVRALSSEDIMVTLSTGGAPVPVQGTVLEQPPLQPNGGGWNTSWSPTGTINFESPLPAGAEINVQFLLGVQQSGTFSIFINVEALP